MLYDDYAPRADELVSKHKVIVILGAVDSDSTEKVVDSLRNLLGDKRVPIVTSLSTAPSLTENRDPWFFRATLDDRERMKKFASHITTEGLASPPYVLLYDENKFGLGLRDALSEALGSSDPIPWSEVRNMSQDDLRARLGNDSKSIFVLGPTQPATALAKQVSAAGEFKFFFVGSDSTLLESAPEGSLTIAEPAADLGDSCALGEERNAVEELKRDFVEKLNNKPQNFRLMSYEVAWFVVPKAIATAIRASGKIPDDETKLRDAVRQALEEETFDSLTPWRKIRLSGGSLQQGPTAPIYRIERRFARQDKYPDPDWAALRMLDTQIGFLEGPARIEVTPKLSREEADLELRVDRLEGSSVTSVMTKTLQVTKTKGGITYPFQPSWVGRFRITTGPGSIATKPKEVYVDVGWRLNYVWSFFAALMGSLLAVWLGRSGSMPALLRVAVGVVVGLGLTAFAFYRSLLPGLQFVPLPTFSEYPTLNAIASGIFGGFAGPEIVITRRK